MPRQWASEARSICGIGCRLPLHVPPRKDKYSGMHLQCTCKNLRTFDTQIDPVILDRGKRRLRNSRHNSQIILAEFLELTDDANGFAYRHIYRPLGSSKILSVRGSFPPIVVRSQFHNEDEHPLGRSHGIEARAERNDAHSIPRAMLRRNQPWPIDTRKTALQIRIRKHR